MDWLRATVAAGMLTVVGFGLAGCGDKTPPKPPPEAPQQKEFEPPKIDMGTETPSTPAKEEKK